MVSATPYSSRVRRPFGQTPMSGNLQWASRVLARRHRRMLGRQITLDHDVRRSASLIRTERAAESLSDGASESH